MRSVVNHGIRVLPYRFHSRHDIKEKDNRWFSSGRWASAYYDASPAVAKKMEVRWPGRGTGDGGGEREWKCEVGVGDWRVEGLEHGFESELGMRVS